MATPPHTIESRIQVLLPELEDIYTDIHAHPELSMQETRTARVAADRLRGAGYDVTVGIGNWSRRAGAQRCRANGDAPRGHGRGRGATSRAHARYEWRYFTNSTSLRRSL